RAPRRALARRAAERHLGLLLRIWGSWFGRPHDNCHQIVEATAEGEMLLVRFDAGERLMVFSPRQARTSHNSRTARPGTGPSLLSTNLQFLHASRRLTWRSSRF